MHTRRRTVQLQCEIDDVGLTYLAIFAFVFLYVKNAFANRAGRKGLTGGYNVYLQNFWISNCRSHIATHLVLILVLLVGTLFLKSLRLRRFKSDRDEIWQDCSSSKYGRFNCVFSLNCAHWFTSVFAASHPVGCTSAQLCYGWTVYTWNSLPASLRAADQSLYTSSFRQAAAQEKNRKTEKNQQSMKSH